jgi:hypothetical protein
VWPEPDARSVRCRVALAGSWEGEDVARLAAGWEDLAESSMGRLLSLDRPTAAPQVAFRGEHLVLDVRLPLGPLVSGLRAAVVADVWEILDVSPRSTPAGPGEPTVP